MMLGSTEQRCSNYYRGALVKAYVPSEGLYSCPFMNVYTTPPAKTLWSPKLSPGVKRNSNVRHLKSIAFSAFVDRAEMLIIQRPTVVRRARV